MTNRKTFVINAILKTALAWADEGYVIRQSINMGVKPNELLDYFSATDIINAISEDPDEDTEDFEIDNFNDVFDNADTLPKNSTLIEGWYMFDDNGKSTEDLGNAFYLFIKNGNYDNFCESYNNDINAYFGATATEVLYVWDSFEKKYKVADYEDVTETFTNIKELIEN